MGAETIEQETLEVIEPLLDQAGPLLPILHALQDHFGHVPPESLPGVASALNLSRAEVHGVVSFYHWFRSKPGGDKTLYICRAESCQAMGGQAVEDAAKQLLGIDYHETTADGSYTLEPVYCLGNCACSPAIMIDEQLHGRVRPDALQNLLKTKP